MQKLEPKTWDEVQRHYAMLQRWCKKRELASEVIDDLVAKNRIMTLIIIGLVALLISKRKRGNVYG